MIPGPPENKAFRLVTDDGPEMPPDVTPHEGKWGENPPAPLAHRLRTVKHRPIGPGDRPRPEDKPE